MSGRTLGSNHGASADGSQLQSRSRRRPNGWWLLVALSVLAAACWPYRPAIDAFFTKRIGAPDITHPHTPISETPDLIARLAVAGDAGTGGDAEFATAAAMDHLEGQREFDALLLLGDNVYEDGDPSRVPETIQLPFAPVLDGATELIAVLGNHDIRDGNRPAHVRAMGMPGRWYSTTFGDVAVIALDSNDPGDPDQLLWLRNTLGPAVDDRVIVIMHHPAYSAGWHGSEPAVQKHFAPLFVEFNVDLVFAGHDHDYQRSREIDGVTYVVTGAAAKLRRTGRADFTEVSWSTHSFVDLALYDDRIVGQAVDHDGRVFDLFTMMDPG